MSDLRDARLRRALESAPDAHMRPDAKTRAAIRAAALGAVAPAAAPAPWWRTVWDSTGRRGPWNAAFATVLLASLVTVLWYDREVPDARTDKVSVAPVPAAPPAAAPAPSPEPPRAEKPVVPRRETPIQAPRRKDASPAPAAPAPAVADAAVPAAPAAPSFQDQERRDLAKAQAPALAEAPPAAGAASPAAPAAPPAVVAQAAPPAAAPMPRSAPAAVAAAPAPAAAAPAARAAEASGSFLQRQQLADVRLVAGDRSTEVAPEQSRRLVELAEAVARAAQGSEPLAAPVTLRIELRRQGLPAGVLEVAGPQVRWRGLTGRPDPALLLALEQEAARLLAR